MRRTARFSYASQSTRPNRRLYLWLVILALLAGLTAWQWFQSRDKPLPTTATLTVLSGEASVTRADAGRGAPLKSGETARLQRGDEVQTSADARAKLTFGEGETTELTGKVRLTLLELHASPLTRALVATLALHEGETLTRLQHTLLRGVKFEIETAVATVQVRGTVFQCKALSKSQVYIAVYEGVVHVAMGEQALDLQPGQAVDARLGQPLVTIPASAAPPASADSASPSSTAAPKGTPTLTEREKTLFPPVLTPTRPGDNYQLYTVQPGDTLSSIARRFGVTSEALLAANRSTLRNPDMLRAGQQLRIPK